ncbi:hypothetical protein HYH03_010183 [Edaphochlamys debaryana]|uniref:Uncharacterized protein n=1 Tax=Edaphochlamys debaryana TaxID=47281 RepID=A0A835XXE4_9CHLO|nr:hypothetical protein HYH03_010183 [Edaphochlamys debaryana]|eukprot:KAG2491392.1 hypothetical protein HYH03_010183 [Edaphochlamys debaryana]
MLAWPRSQPPAPRGVSRRPRRPPQPAAPPNDLAAPRIHLRSASVTGLIADVVASVAAAGDGAPGIAPGSATCVGGLGTSGASRGPFRSVRAATVGGLIVSPSSVLQPAAAASPALQRTPSRYGQLPPSPLAHAAVGASGSSARSGGCGGGVSDGAPDAEDLRDLAAAPSASLLSSRSLLLLALSACDTAERTLAAITNSGGADSASGGGGNSSGGGSRTLGEGSHSASAPALPLLDATGAGSSPNASSGTDWRRRLVPSAPVSNDARPASLDGRADAGGRRDNAGVSEGGSNGTAEALPTPFETAGLPTAERAQGLPTAGLPAAQPAAGPAAAEQATVVPPAAAAAPTSKAPGGGGGGAWGRLAGGMARPSAAATGPSDPATASSPASAAAAPAAASAAATTLAFQALHEMKEKDEFSLVAAARRRQRQVDASTAGGSGGGSGGGGSGSGGGGAAAAPLGAPSRSVSFSAARWLRAGSSELGDGQAEEEAEAQAQRILEELLREPLHARSMDGRTSLPAGNRWDAVASHPPSFPLSRAGSAIGHAPSLRRAASSVALLPSSSSSPSSAIPPNPSLGLGHQPSCRALGLGPAEAGADERVAALAERYGAAPPPPPSPQAGPEAGWRLQRHRSMKIIGAVVAANPAAYAEHAAEAAEAEYRHLAQQAHGRLAALEAEPDSGPAGALKLDRAVQSLRSLRPYFLPPVLGRDKAERAHVEQASEEVRVWSLDQSIFALRKKETESRDLFDSDKVRSAQLALDWQRVVAKERFRRVVSRGDSGVRSAGQSLEQELAEVRGELEAAAGFIRSAYAYYSNHGGGISSSDVFKLTCGSWMAFCADAGILSEGSRGTTAQDMQTIFIAVNFEEETDTAEAEANDDDAMVRFEFIEGLVRAAFGKYIATKRMDDASDAVGALLAEVQAAPGLPPEAKVDPNDFRRERFYLEDVEVVLIEYRELLTAAHKLYKARDRTKYFWPEHWLGFLDSNKLLGLATGVERREAKLVFAWSQSLVTDELRRRQRAVSLQPWDFIEAVARLADLLSPPDHQDILAFFKREGLQPPAESDRLVYEYYRAVGDAGTRLKRPSAELVCSPTRPLAAKLRLLCEYLAASLREAWGGREQRETAAKVAKMATYLSGGIEMG